MSADAKDRETDVWLFERLVMNRPAKGSNDYPVAIKASHLDHNWKKTTLRPPKNVDAAEALYEVSYDKDGTRITRILPNGTNTGDLLYWDGDNRWRIFAAPSSLAMHVLTITDGRLEWTPTEACEE
jgi:hypothetical protein